MPGPHDIGGKEAGAVPRAEHVFAPWERRVDAMQRILGGGGKEVYSIDELRRSIESLSPAEYGSASYYERWIKAITALLVEKGVVTRGEIDGRLAALRQG